MQNDDTSMHLYYGPDKGGFLTVTVARENGVPTARFRHVGVRPQRRKKDLLDRPVERRSGLRRASRADPVVFLPPPE